MMTYAAENPLELIVSSDLKRSSKASSTLMISGGIYMKKTHKCINMAYVMLSVIGHKKVPRPPFVNI